LKGGKPAGRQVWGMLLSKTKDKNEKDNLCKTWES
jgi:hypothetical protein